MDYRRTRSSIRPPFYSNKLSNFLQTFHFCFPAYRRTVFNVSFTFDTSRQFLREFFGEEKKIFFEKFKILISKLKFLSFYTPTSFLFVALFERLKRLNTHTKKKKRLQTFYRNEKRRRTKGRTLFRSFYLERNKSYIAKFR